MTATQIQFRRGSAAQMATFTGAVGEVVVDTTNNRVVVQDGATAGGWPSEIAARTAISDANYTVKNTDRTIAYTAISAARTVQLLAAASYPTGARLLIVDESQAASASRTITPVPAGSDTINKASTAPPTGIVSVPGGSVALESDGASNWTVVAPNLASGVSSLNALTGAIGVSYPIGTAGSNVVAVAPWACGRLAYVSATQIKLSPHDGDLIRIAGVDYQIPSGGVTAANTSVYVNGTAGQNLAASTLYYVYLFNNSGTLTVNFSTTGHLTDATAGNVGTEIESGNNACTLIGMVYTNASSQFGGAALVASWFSRQNKAVSGTVSNFTTTATTRTTIASNVVQFLAWSDDAIFVSIDCIPYNSVSGDYGQLYVLDQNANEYFQFTSLAANININPYYQLVPTSAFAEGLVSLALAALSQASGNTFAVANCGMYAMART